MIGQKIFFFRKSKGMTQEQLAQGICSISHLSKIENGHEVPSEDTLSHLCNRLGINIKDIDKTQEYNEFSELLEEWYSFMVNKERTEAAQMLPILQEKKEMIQDPDLLLKYKLYYVRFALMKYDLQEAESGLAEIIQYYKSLQPKMKYFFQFCRGALEYIKGDYAEAHSYLKQAEEISHDMFPKNPELYYLLALTHSKLHNVTFSINYASQALELFRQNFQMTRCLDCEVLLGINNRRLKNYAAAEKHYLNALKGAKSLKYDELTYINYHNLGVLYRKTDSKKAIDYFLKSLEQLELGGLFEKEKKFTETCHCLAEEYLVLGELNQMLYWIEQGEKTARKHQLTATLLQFKVLRCRANEYNDIEKEYLLKTEIIPYFMEKKLWHFVADYAQLLADLYYKKNKYKNASHYYQLVIHANHNFLKY